MTKTREELERLNEMPGLKDAIEKLTDKPWTEIMSFQELAVELGLSAEDMDNFRKVASERLQVSLRRKIMN